MRADGSHQMNLTNNSAFDFVSDWQPRAHRHNGDGGAPTDASQLHGLGC
jgi:hypothetical protein